MTSPAPSSASTQEITDTSLRQFVGYNMKRAFNAIHADLIHTLRSLELRMVTFSALALIVENPGLRQAQLADALSIERPNLVMVIDELEKKNWIARAPVSSDRRAYALSATSRGKRQCNKALAALFAHEARMLEGLSKRNRVQLASWLQAIETVGSDTA